MNKALISEACEMLSKHMHETPDQMMETQPQSDISTIRKRRATEYSNDATCDKDSKYLDKFEYLLSVSKARRRKEGVIKIENGYQQKIRSLDKCPVFSRSVNRQFSGTSHSRLSQLLSGTITKTKDLDIIYSYDVLNQIRILDSHARTWHYTKFDKGILYKSLKKMNSLINNFDRNRIEGGLPEDPEVIRKNALMFLQFGGVHILLRILMLPKVANFEPTHKKEKSHYMRNKCLIFQMLCNLISMQTHYELEDRKKGTTRNIGPNVADFLSIQHMDDDMTILDFAFYCMSDEQTALPACQFIEDLLQAKQEVFNLSQIKNLKKIITTFDQRQLANFCRICAITISDLDVYQDKSSLFQQNKQKRSLGFINIRDINQEFLLNIGNLLPRLVMIATSEEYLPREGNSMGELSQWMDWINITMDNSIYDEDSTDDFHTFIGGISAQTSINGPMIQQLGLHISGTLILRVQVVYVLGLFLVGKHRKKVQRRLADLHMIPGLSRLFDKFIWKCVANQDDNQLRLRGHNDACECSPEVALKIQFLRLIHSFCDHSDHKHLLLSRVELDEIKNINDGAKELKINTLSAININLMCKGNKGLLTKIVDVMKLEPITSTFRFWLARAVESYLRGSPSYCDQIFLLNRGLLEHIVNNIVNHNICLKEILQSSFDLIGEMVKFNLEAFRSFDRILNTPEKLQKFYATVNKNLVDSNMFIRSLVLSVEHFRVYNLEAEPDCILLKHIGSFNQQILYLQQLIRLISVENLTQENVSCLNTTLVFLMFANRRNQLPPYLSALSKPIDQHSDNLNTLIVFRKQARNSIKRPNNNLVSNFRDLLIFWQDHYLHKDKDCSALEKSSRIKFDYWKSTVNTLASVDGCKSTSTLHYIFNRSAESSKVRRNTSSTSAAGDGGSNSENRDQATVSTEGAFPPPSPLYFLKSRDGVSRGEGSRSEVADAGGEERVSGEAKEESRTERANCEKKEQMSLRPLKPTPTPPRCQREIDDFEAGEDFDSASDASLDD